MKKRSRRMNWNPASNCHLQIIDYRAAGRIDIDAAVGFCVTTFCTLNPGPATTPDMALTKSLSVVFAATVSVAVCAVPVESVALMVSTSLATMPRLLPFGSKSEVSVGSGLGMTPAFAGLPTPKTGRYA